MVENEEMNCFKPASNLWGELKFAVGERNSASVQKLEQIAKKE